MYRLYMRVQAQAYIDVSTRGVGQKRTFH